MWRKTESSAIHPHLFGGFWEGRVGGLRTIDSLLGYRPFVGLRNAFNACVCYLYSTSGDRLGNERKNRLGGLVRRAAKKGRRLISEAKAKTPSAPPHDEASVAFVGPDGETIQDATVAAGTSILAIAQNLGIDIDHFCGGQCSCGTCRIKVLNGAQHLSGREASEELVLGASNVGAGSRLACQAKVNGPVRIEIPRWF